MGQAVSYYDYKHIVFSGGHQIARDVNEYRRNQMKSGTPVDFQSDVLIPEEDEALTLSSSSLRSLSAADPPYFSLTAATACESRDSSVDPSAI